MKVDRRTIYERDQGLCGLCGDPVAYEVMELDHITPRMVGGSDAPDNLRVAHKVCNRERGRADRRTHGYRRGNPSPFIRPNVLNIRLDTLTERRLAWLMKRFGVGQSDTVRLAIEEAAQRYKMPSAELAKGPTDEGSY